MGAAIPRAWTVAATSVLDQRESGRPESRGRVHARAVTCARWTEGKKTRLPRRRGIPESRPVPGPGAPGADRSIGTADRLRDRRVAPLGMLIGQEQNLRPDPLGGRRGAPPSQPPKRRVLLR